MQAGFKAWLKLLMDWIPRIKQAKRHVTAQEAGASRGWLQINDVWTVLIYTSTNSLHFQKQKEKNPILLSSGY